MKLYITKSHIQNLIKLGLFAFVVIIIIQLFPSQDSFSYRYEVGKPWTHEIITAPFDFPIYKSDEQIAKEREEIMKDFSPYFLIDTTYATQKYNDFITNYESENLHHPVLSFYLQQKFRNLYRTGIISVEDENKLLAKGIQNIQCIYPDRVTRQVAVSELYTPREAYEEILHNTTSEEKNILSSYNLNLFLSENIKYDSINTKLSEEALLKGLSLTMGIVQTGEKVIDRGEIVSPETYLILNSLKFKYEEQNSSFQQSGFVLIGKMMIVSGFILLLFFYFYLFRPRIFEGLNNLLLILSLVLLMVSLASFAIHFSSNVLMHYFMVPYALLPIIIRVFYDSRTALFTHMVTSVIISLMVDDPYQFLVIQIAVGMLAVSSLKDLAQRSQLTQTAFYLFLCYCAAYTAFSLVSEGSFERISWLPILYFAVSCIMLLFAYILIYLFEKIFGLVSSVTLVELTNINSDLMIQFSEAAPGSFQHSLQVSNIATEAAKRINANSLLVRTGALYHDIGKMNNASYFTENQMGAKNPLLDMDYEEASHIIIDHVSDGMKIAKKHHLPDQISIFISTHHGNSKVRYFYNLFVNENPDKIPNEKAFTYPGPLPNSKETAILMMADAVEARSRSLKEYSIEGINIMVEDMINMQISDGQFKYAPITFQDVEIVKQVFKEKLINIYHTRIVYPTIKNNA